MTSRQEGKSVKYQNLSRVTQNFLKKINKLKRNFIKNRINKYLYSDNSSLCWGENDNFKSVTVKLSLRIFRHGGYKSK